ncbi:putative bacteriochlorophyll synthase [Corchorus olitorius]|uniref:Bacteriochlorophyll synthase n=1 Tax=Corchorus olitorius TaxID=93759 RepID=A0A1R3J458_9ROSI|nr:putative bacteriochlorophyll synthase [Corchorus olitorius]
MLRFRVSIAVNPHCKTSSCQPKAIPSKLNGKLCKLPLKFSKNVVPFGLCNRRSCSSHVPTRQFKRNSIWEHSTCYAIAVASAPSDFSVKLLSP